jgi:CBS domain containing-hemolysin-like protein
MLADILVYLFSRTQLEEVLDEGDAGRITRWLCAPFLQKPRIISQACSLLRILAVSAYLVFGLTTWQDDLALSVLVAALLIPLLLAGLGVNALANLRTEETLVTLTRPLWVLTLPLRPVAHVMVSLEDRLGRALNGRSEEDEEDRDDIIAAVTDGEHEGVVEEDEREMIVNIFDLKTADLSDIMTPRTEITALPITTTVQEAVLLASEKGYSRIPVYRDTRDNILGVFHVKDALNHWGLENGELPTLEEILRPAMFVPESKNVTELLKEMQAKKTHIAVVLDEYGGTAGLVTIEDIVEEIVGEIHDEYDPEEVILLRHAGNGVLEAHARTHIHRLNQALGGRILPEDGDYETLGGFLLHQMGHIPSVNEHLAWDGVRFTILSSDERRIGRVRVEPNLSEHQGDPAAPPVASSDPADGRRSA